jgi:hypothetical protein
VLLKKEPQSGISNPGNGKSFGAEIPPGHPIATQKNLSPQIPAGKQILC